MALRNSFIFLLGIWTLRKLPNLFLSLITLVSKIILKYTLLIWGFVEFCNFCQVSGCNGLNFDIYDGDIMKKCWRCDFNLTLTLMMMNIILRKTYNNVKMHSSASLTLGVRDQYLNKISNTAFDSYLYKSWRIYNDIVLLLEEYNSLFTYWRFSRSPEMKWSEQTSNFQSSLYSSLCDAQHQFAHTHVMVDFFTI